MALSEPTPESDPFELFRAWYEAHASTGPHHPDAMLLATATRDGQPSLRTVLLKNVEGGAYRFFTSYESRKARELDLNPQVALLFFWPAIGRQVRIEGHVSRISPAESDEYFATRRRESQLSACASPQSREVARDELLARRALLEQRFEGKPIPRPQNWGGYAVVPRTFEFWINDETRLHYRHTYTRSDEGWRYAELGP
jgi:pyridoxamine 5'-phosphate oxidase